MQNKLKIAIGILLFPLLSMAQTNIRVEGDLDAPCYFVYSNDYLFADSVRIEVGEKIKVKVDKFLIGTLKYKSKTFPIFLEEYDDLKIRIEGDNISFSSVGAANNTFFQTYIDQSKEEVSYYEKSIDALEIKAFDMYESEKKLLTEYPKYDFLTRKFTKHLKTESKYKYQKAMLIYGVLQKKTERIPTDFIPKFDLEDFNNPEKLRSASFREFLFYYSVYKAIEENNFDHLSSMTGMYILHSYWLNQHVRELLNYNLEYELILKYHKEMEASILKNKMEVLAKNKVEPSYSRLKKRVEPYTIIEKSKEEEEFSIAIKDLVAVDIKGKEVRLSDFRKKIVYVDIWASWCGPCRREFPHSIRLQEELTGKTKKNVVFLYISIDENEAKWKAALDKLGIKGEHWNSKGGWNSDAAQFFGISGIPRYVIIGKDGRILDPNAPRPSSLTIKSRLMMLAR